MAELKATPRNKLLGMISDALAGAKRQGNKVDLPILGGLGDLLIGKSPEEINEWSYGNLPARVPEMTRIPMMKPGRAEQLLNVANVAPIVSPLARVAKNVPAALRHGAQEFAHATAAAAPRAVKLKGGNWLRQSGLEYLDELAGEMNPVRLAALRAGMGQEAGLNQEHLGKWVKGPLTKYIKNQLGTADDPLLALADQGISPMDLRTLLDPPQWVRSNARSNRAMGGFNKLGLVDPGTGYSKGWEDWSDSMVRPQRAGDTRRNLGKYLDEYTSREPGFERIPNDAMVYEFAGDEAPYHLGFQDTVEALRKGLDPASNLPPGLRLKPEDLQQMGMEKAVRYQNSIKEAEKAIEEQKRIRLMEQMGKQGRLVKEYPSGHKIVELNMPESVDDQMMASIRKNPDGTFSPLDADGNVIQRREMDRGSLVDVVESTPERAQLGGMLANEGNAMGHCVGGYCEDVARGTHRIYSLRDAKGEPHVTMETSGKFDTQGYDWEGAPIVFQVYGKANTKPKEEYHKMLQDFVRSGDYEIDSGDVMRNVNLEDITDYKQHIQDAVEAQIPNARYLTPEELQPFINAHYDNNPGSFATRDYKEGGLIEDDYGMPGFF